MTYLLLVLAATVVVTGGLLLLGAMFDCFTAIGWAIIAIAWQLVRLCLWLLHWSLYAVGIAYHPNTIDED